MGRNRCFWLFWTFLGVSLPLAALAAPPTGDAPDEAPPAAESTPDAAEPPQTDEEPAAEPPTEPDKPENPAPPEPNREESPAPGAPEAKPDQPKPDQPPKEDPKEESQPTTPADEPKTEESRKDGEKAKPDDKAKPREAAEPKNKTDGEDEDEKGDKESKEAAKAEPRRVEWDDKVAAVIEKPSPESLDDLRVIQKQLQRVVDAATPATVSVRVGNAFGSGVIVSADGLVLTAGHVVGQPNVDVTFIFPDGKTAKGKTLGMNQQIDSGMMKITDPGPWPFVPVAKAGNIKGGQWVVAIGQPGGFDRERTPPVRLGRVLFANGDVINTDCTLVGGDSGGPLFNMQGEVVGIHSRIGRRITNNFHVPISTYHETWDRLAAAESWGNRLGGSEPVRTWPMLGIAGKRGAEKCEVTQVYPNRPAAAAGLKVGDVITSFAGKPVESFEHLGKLMADQKPLSQVEVELKRGDETLKLNVRLGITNRRIPGSYNDQTKPS